MCFDVGLARSHLVRVSATSAGSGPITHAHLLVHPLACLTISSEKVVNFVVKINPSAVVSVDHIWEFFALWMLVHDFHLDSQTEDDIVWKHSNNGIYLAATPYKA